MLLKKSHRIIINWSFIIDDILLVNNEMIY